MKTLLGVFFYAFLNSTLTNTLFKCHIKPFSLIFCIRYFKKQIGDDARMCKDNKQTKCKQLEFNTYCIFTEEKKDVKETIGLIFKDYLEKIKIKTK